MLKLYHRSIASFAFVCGKEARTEELHQLFVVFKDFYMFEIEKIMIRDKIYCTIIYVSASPSFLRIEDHSLVEFLVSELALREPTVNPSQMAALLEELFRAELHLPVCNTMGELKVSRHAKKEYFSLFVHLMTQRYEKSIPIFSKFEHTSKLIESKHSYQNAKASMNSNYSSGTALFNSNDVFMHSFKEEGEDEMESRGRGKKVVPEKPGESKTEVCMPKGFISFSKEFF